MQELRNKLASVLMKMSIRLMALAIDLAPNSINPPAAPAGGGGPGIPK